MLARLSPGSRVLEIGSGEGELAAMLAGAGHRVTAIDRRLRSDFPTIEGDFNTHDFGDARFDCIVAMLVIHHAHDLPATLRKIKTLLAPGGFVAFDDYGWERHPNPTPEWRDDRKDLLTSVQVLQALDAAFEREYYADHAYLDDAEGTDSMAFTYFGFLR